MLVREPICISANPQQGIIVGGIATQWTLASLAHGPPTLPPELFGAEGSSSAAEQASLTDTVVIMGACPYVQVTVLSAEVAALPLFQFRVGSEEEQLSVTVQKFAGTPVLATEAAVLVEGRYYNAPLFAWEPLIEPFAAVAVRRAARLDGGQPERREPLTVNVTDAMMRACWQPAGGHAPRTRVVRDATRTRRLRRRAKAPSPRRRRRR